LDKLGKLIMPLLEDDVDIRPGLVDVIGESDQHVVEADHIGDEYNQSYHEQASDL
jgi:hypothetical protein